MYNNFFTDNYHVNCYELIGIDNRKLNLGLSILYNQIIQEYIDDECWLFSAMKIL
ncbi:MAG: hypothetical protein H6680_05305 [Desulfobacteraceae bacterium]|nr:hypothetical protein [Desulfobacteraceae bacterium]